MPPHPVTTKTYASRAAAHPNPTARRLLETMERKKTNLCVSVDVTTSAEILDIVRQVAPFVCMVKTHIDIVEDFTIDLANELKRLADELDFVIFEDRKFADIGNTVELQYKAGVHKIASWSHLTNAHVVPGPGIITGLGAVGKPLGNALILLAEMSSAGNLASGEYTAKAVQMAREAGLEWVVGFIAMGRVDKADDPDFLVITPGVGLDVKGDGRGQQYRTPHEVVYESGCDVIIVGRGIYKNKEAVASEAKRYQEAGWKAYEERLQRTA
ncbi:orotidine 5'-phosphate decarboxylase [Vanrija albida]|uniref:Orotidine 5'-phosphate decarboxylase n=1 Tax=Vanrija albida TaxID=181172 RepID=A0ABR3QD18_9TREE